THLICYSINPFEELIKGVYLDREEGISQINHIILFYLF
ncbi:hypothetical protein PFNF54_05220, partial [Plasmodium falciparum NF54]